MTSAGVRGGQPDRPKVPPQRPQHRQPDQQTGSPPQAGRRQRPNCQGGADRRRAGCHVRLGEGYRALLAVQICQRGLVGHQRQRAQPTHREDAGDRADDARTDRQQRGSGGHAGQPAPERPSPPPTSPNPLAGQPKEESAGSKGGKMQTCRRVVEIERRTQKWHRRPDRRLQVGEEPQGQISQPSRLRPHQPPPCSPGLFRTLPHFKLSDSPTRPILTQTENRSSVSTESGAATSGAPPSISTRPSPTAAATTPVTTSKMRKISPSEADLPVPYAPAPLKRCVRCPSLCSMSYNGKYQGLLTKWYI